MALPRFYVILSGSVGIYIKEVMASEVQEEDEPVSPTARDCSRGVCFEVLGSEQDMGVISIRFLTNGSLIL